MLVMSVVDGEIVDADVTDRDGRFEVMTLPTYLEDGDDGLVALALHVNDDGTRIDYTIADPGTGGAVEVERAVRDGLPLGEPWAWAWRAGEVPAAGGVYVPVAAGSGAIFAFVYLDAIYRFALGRFPAAQARGLIVWLGLDTTWSCGACFYDVPALLDSAYFGSQIFLPGGPSEGFWSGPVTAHELGHWLMSTFGVSPGEGGPHVLGVPAHPGLAWSEGFATWFSAKARGDSRYYDKQNGLFFWLDHGQRLRSDLGVWPRPQASAGLEQMIDESEITAMMLGLSFVDAETMLTAIASPRMTTSPFLRGYLRRAWDGLDSEKRPLPAWSTDVSVPHFADYLDALVCEAIASPSEIDSVTLPWLHYPYPSSVPLCRSASSPIEVSFEEERGQLIANVRWHIALESELTLAFVPHDSAVAIIPAGTPPGRRRLAFAGSPDGPTGRSVELPAGLSVSLDGPNLKVHGVVPLRPLAPTPPAKVPVALDFRGVKIRAAIPLTAVQPEARAPTERPGFAP
jgi:hypothetical protein